MTKYLFSLMVMVLFSCADPAKWRNQQRINSIEASKKSDSLERLMNSHTKPVHSEDTIVSAKQ